MRIIQTVNDTIRLLFNPKTEIFSLSDFLLVRDSDENFLAQVVEVYDDKFDQEANVAKIKLIYRIVNGNEIKPYDNYTPSRECEVAKIKQSEIEKCINLDKKTIPVGKSYKTKEVMQLNTDFFDNNCVIFADKFEQTNRIFETLSPKLSGYKNVLILDFSGTCKIEGAKAYSAGENFRLPFSYDTIDYIRQKTLLRAKLETQVVLGDVFEEVKKFLLTDEEKYIPYSKFIKVIQNQCKLTPSVELLVLVSWLKKYAGMGIFAKNKKEFESFFKSIEKNKITTLDLSNLKVEWQKEHVEYILNHIQNEVFVLIRLNDNNINNDILNSVYLKNKNISFIPSFAYGYKKASYIMEFAQNYILMPTLNPKKDFAHANFQIQSLNKESFMLFGEDTKDFIFTLEIETPVKPKEDDDKDKLFISLNLQLEDMMPLELRPNNFEVRPHQTRKKRLQEEIKLSDVLGEKENNSEENKEEEILQNTEETPAAKENTADNTTPPQKEEETKPVGESAAEIDDTSYDENILNEDELDYYTEEIPSAPEISENTTESAADVEEEIKDKADFEPEETVEKEEISISSEEKEPVIIQETKAEEIEKEPEIKPLEKNIEKSIEKSIEKVPPEIKDEKKEPEENKIKETAPDMPKIKPSDKAGEEKIRELENKTELKSELAEFAKIQESSFDENEKEENNVIIDDNILDVIDEANGIKTPDEVEPTSLFKEALKKSEEENENSKKEVIEKTKDIVSTIIDEVVSEKINDTIKDEKTIKALQTSAEENVDKDDKKEESDDKQEAQVENEDEIDKKFDEIINSEEEINVSSKLQINENVSIDLEKIKKEIKKPEHKLPVFNDENEKEEEIIPQAGFSEGETVLHDKYGEGKILKVIKYGNRCLLQIEFPEIGKRLLDPKIAKLKIAEEI